MAPLGDMIKVFLDQSGIGRSLGQVAVFDAWTQVVGEPLAKRARPVRLRHGELLVEVDSSAQLQELKTFTGEGYRLAANRALGRDAIRRVVFKLKR